MKVHEAIRELEKMNVEVARLQQRLEIVPLNEKPMIASVIERTENRIDLLRRAEVIF